MHLAGIIRSNFKQWTPFEPPVLRGGITLGAEADEYDFADLLFENEQSIYQLRESANTAGLTTTNIIARKLDDINNKLHITGIIEKTPLILGIGYFAMLATPENWVKNVPVLSYLKEKIGPDLRRRK